MGREISHDRKSPLGGCVPRWQWDHSGRDQKNKPRSSYGETERLLGRDDSRLSLGTGEHNRLVLLSNWSLSPGFFLSSSLPCGSLASCGCTSNSSLGQWLKGGPEVQRLWMVLEFGIFGADPLARSLREIKIPVKRGASEFLFLANCPVWAQFTSEFVRDSSLLSTGQGARQTSEELLAFSKAIKNKKSSNKYWFYASRKPKG